MTKTVITSNRVSASLEIGVVRADYGDVLTDIAAVFVTKKGTPLPWLEWLLKFGDKAIVRGYDVAPAASSRRSRTGRLIMKAGRGKRWKVPSEFSGTLRNNFVTRALDGLEPTILKIMESSIKAT
ncbi:unnamed protein product [marine sediment metagenome]|uniref:Uncharacterized protein n=1 Tax=marine sediment metagenome TaxID=412755 RepID=X1CN68_9ZZZZ